MNKARRKEVVKVVKQIRELVQDILDEEQDAYYNMPESFQESENGLISADAQESLEAAKEALEEAISCLEEIDQ